MTNPNRHREKRSDEQKNMIRRDFIVKHLSDTFGNRKQSHLLLEFASLHFPEEVQKIKGKYSEVYRKRHQRIEERIRELQPTTNSQEEPAPEISETVAVNDGQVAQPEISSVSKIVEMDDMETVGPEAEISEAIVASEEQFVELEVLPMLEIVNGNDRETLCSEAEFSDVMATSEEEPDELEVSPLPDDIPIYLELPEQASISEMPEEEEHIFAPVNQEEVAA